MPVFIVIVSERSAPRRIASIPVCVDKDREAVDDDHAVEACFCQTDLREGEAEGDGKTQYGEHGGNPFIFFGDKEVNEQENTCPHSEEDVRGEYFVISWC
jgi:hypothetical protein